MPDLGIYTLNASIVAKAGINASSTASAVGETDKYVLMVEAFVNVATRHNWSDEWSGTPPAPTKNADVAWIVPDVSTSLCAINVINADMSQFASRNEAEAMISVLRDSALRGLSVLRDLKAQDFMNGA